MSQSSVFSSDMSRWPAISSEIWSRKYRLSDASGAPVDRSWADTVARVARAAASAEASGVRAHWETRFAEAMETFAFIPGGRILAGAGTDRKVTLFNCFVMGEVRDDLGSIFDSVKDAALTMQMGGGIGQDFSPLRPKGARVESIGADASGPVSFMDVWDSMCRTIMSAGARRGAMMATLRCDHPDIELFIDAKRDPARLRNFNVSVLVTDAFVAAVRAGAPWPLVFGGRVVRTVDARGLWDRLMQATYDVAEPGVVFIDRVNARNNLDYCETISATNPCGEQPLPPYGACLLGALNLASFVRAPFSPTAVFDDRRLRATAAVAVRFLDNVIDISRYPLEAQEKEAKSKRRIGLGVTGLADALLMLGVRYGSKAAIDLTDGWLRAVKEAAYDASITLAREKGAFPLADGTVLVTRPNIAALSADMRRDIAAVGLRNGCLTTIAPTGTTSLLAGNVSSGIEPIFAASYERRLLGPDGSHHVEHVEDFACRLFRERSADGLRADPTGAGSPLPPAFVDAATLSPSEHLAMQAAAQAHVDSAISKTINVAADLPFDDFKSIYLEAHALGLKGCTTYRPNPTTGSVLAVPAATATATATATAPPPAIDAASAASAAVVPVTSVETVQPRERPSRDGAVVYMAKPLQRDTVLSGLTYKVRWPRSEHAIYITINDVEIDGRRRPFEIFINTKNLDHYAWTIALTRMMSAVFRRGGDVGFVVEELRAVFDPQGGAWMDGRYVPSLLAAIGDVIDTHLRRGDVPAPVTDVAVRTAAMGQPGSDPGAAASVPRTSTSGMSPSPSPGKPCPKCGRPTWQRIGGCWTCATCQFSQCD